MMRETICQSNPTDILLVKEFRRGTKAANAVYYQVVSHECLNMVDCLIKGNFEIIPDNSKIYLCIWGAME